MFIEHPRSKDDNPEMETDYDDASALESGSISTVQENSAVEVSDADCVVNYDIGFKVSSKHLTLTSPVFKALINSGMSESTRLSNTGTTDIQLPEDYSQCMEVLLYIIHGKSRRLPKEMTPQLLMEIALMVDKYGLHEAVQPFTGLWFKDFKRIIPKRKWCPAVSWWIALCLILDYWSSFTHLTGILLANSMKLWTPQRLPI